MITCAYRDDNLSIQKSKHSSIADNWWDNFHSVRASVISRADKILPKVLDTSIGRGCVNKSTYQEPILNSTLLGRYDWSDQPNLPLANKDLNSRKDIVYPQDPIILVDPEDRTRFHKPH